MQTYLRVRYRLLNIHLITYAQTFDLARKFIRINATVSRCIMHAAMVKKKFECHFNKAEAELALKVFLSPCSFRIIIHIYQLQKQRVPFAACWSSMSMDSMAWNLPREVQRKKLIDNMDHQKVFINWSRLKCDYVVKNCVNFLRNKSESMIDSDDRYSKALQRINCIEYKIKRTPSS